MRVLGIGVAALLIVLVLSAGLWLPDLGLYLLADDGPAPADVVIVLGGNAPARLPRAQQLVAEGYAPRVLVSDERVRTYGMDVAWHDLYRAGLAAPDLPPDAVIVMGDPPPLSTVDEAERAARMLVDRGLRSALLVTDAYHSRRAGLLFAAEFKRHGLSVRSTPALDDVDDLRRWWERPRMARHVLEEYVKLGSYLIQGRYW